jgi:hypothetical protein
MDVAQVGWGDDWRCRLAGGQSEYLAAIKAVAGAQGSGPGAEQGVDEVFAVFVSGLADGEGSWVSCRVTAGGAGQRPRAGLSG